MLHRPYLIKLLFVFTLACQVVAPGNIRAQAPKPVNIKVDVADKGAAFKNMWAYFGYDEPNYTYMKDGKKLLNELAALSPHPVYVRTHNLLTTGDGKADLKWGSTNAYTEDANGNPVYNWHLVDSIFDTFIKRGMKPIAEIGFMPEALSVHPQPYRHNWKPGMPYQDVFTGWAYPPKDYKKWEALVYEWVKHCVDRYGEAEVNTWWWEVWNEPNIGYWKGKPEDYFKLYDYAAEAVKKACPNARIGGPTTTGPSWSEAAKFLGDFLTHCSSGTNYATGKAGAPLNYISFHAKGSPKLVDGHVRMNMATELTDIEKGCAIVAGSPFKNIPVIIGECDPEGCAACGMATNPENAYRNGVMYSSYTASSFSRIYDIAERYHVTIEGAVSWSFEFENQKWFYGFRDLATNGVDKPVLNVFRMFGLMHGNRVSVGSPGATPMDSIVNHSVHGVNTDINAMAVADSIATTVMVWNYHDDDLPRNAAPVRLSFKNIPSAKVKVLLYQVDETYSNSYTLWKKMGSKQDITPIEYRQLEQAGHLHETIISKRANVNSGNYLFDVELPLHGVYLVKLLYVK